MKPSLPQGMRDFGSDVVRRRQYIFSTLKQIFEIYGFQPLETPAMENLSTLTGKYGEEGDRLIFKVLNNGLNDAARDKDKLRADWNSILERPVSLPSITERALRYDLTIPFARYVATNHQELAMPFRRYQMQPVWRADRPQRGRYREFYQCDADVVGSTSLLNEAELICIYQQAFAALRLPDVTIKVNSRKLLASLAEACGHADLMIPMTVALDKLDKIGWEGVTRELLQRGLDEPAVETLKGAINLAGTNEEKLAGLESLLKSKNCSSVGIDELRETLAFHREISQNTWQAEVEVDFSLARGLSYYTGVIMEVITSAVKMGSIGGGGRYDDLTGLFGVKGISGVGVSFGIDRIYDVLEELALFPDEVEQRRNVLIINAGKETLSYALSVLKDLREAEISAELYPDPAKLDKQLKFANKKGFGYVVFAGEKEQESQQIGLKNFSSGEQEDVSVKEAIVSLRT